MINETENSFDINEKKLNLNDSHLSKDNFKSKKKVIESLDIKPNLSFSLKNSNNKLISENKNAKINFSSKNQLVAKNSKEMKNKTINKYKTFYGKININTEKINEENSNQNKTKLRENKSKSKGKNL